MKIGDVSKLTFMFTSQSGDTFVPGEYTISEIDKDRGYVWLTMAEWCFSLTKSLTIMEYYLNFDTSSTTLPAGNQPLLPLLECECGQKNKTGAIKHSDYCPLYDEKA